MILVANITIYEITDVNESMPSKICSVGKSILKPLVPTNAKEGAVLVVSSAIGLASLKVGAVAVGAYRYYKEPKGKIKKITLDTVETGFKNANGNTWVESQYYIQHPKQKRKNLLIEANSFIRYLEDERLGEILDYLIKEGRFNQIKIKSNNKFGFKGKIGATGFSLPVSSEKDDNGEAIKVDANISANNTTNAIHEVVFSCKKLPPKRTDNEADYVWIDSFKKLTAVVENSKITEEGEIFIQEEFVNDFQIDASLSSMINLDFNVETDKNYTITIEAKRTFLKESFWKNFL